MDKLSFFMAMTSLSLCIGSSPLFASTGTMLTQQAAAYTKITVRLPGKVSISDDDLLKTITDSSQISKITKFVDEQLGSEVGWRPEWDGVSIAPEAFLRLIFYDEGKYKRNFGIGGNFFSTHSEAGGYKIKRVSRRTWKEFLDLIGITEEEYHNLVRERDTPGPWKKKN